MGALANIPFLAGYSEQDALNREKEKNNLGVLAQLLQMQKGGTEIAAMQDKLAQDRQQREIINAFATTLDPTKQAEFRVDPKGFMDARRSQEEIKAYLQSQPQQLKTNLTGFEPIPATKAGSPFAGMQGIVGNAEQQIMDIANDPAIPMTDKQAAINQIMNQQKAGGPTQAFPAGLFSPNKIISAATKFQLAEQDKQDARKENRDFVQNVIEAGRNQRFDENQEAIDKRQQRALDAMESRQRFTVEHRVGNLTPEQNEALFGVNGAVTTGKLDMGKVNSRTASIYADAAIKSPNTDFAKLSGDIALGRNAGFRQRAITAEIMPEILNNVVEAGKKVDFSDNRTMGNIQKWMRGEFNDPALTEYMTLRNDALLSLAGVFRGNGATDQAHKAEMEAANPTMNQASLDAWMRGQLKALEPRLKVNRQITKSGEVDNKLPEKEKSGILVPVNSEQMALTLPPGTRFKLPDGRTGTAR